MPINHSARWKRLAALGAIGEIPTPDGDARMSAVILELAKPLTTQHGETLEDVKLIIKLTVAGWNISVFPPETRPIVEKEIIESFVPKDGGAKAVGLAVEVMNTVAEQRQKLFPDLRRVIVDYEIDIAGGKLTLSVSSASVPDSWREREKEDVGPQ
jgi:hypothetical protein